MENRQRITVKKKLKSAFFLAKFVIFVLLSLRRLYANGNKD